MSLKGVLILSSSSFEIDINLSALSTSSSTFLFLFFLAVSGLSLLALYKSALVLAVGIFVLAESLISSGGALVFSFSSLRG